MASLSPGENKALFSPAESLYSQFETNLMSNGNVIELLLQLKSTKAHGENYLRVKAQLVHHLLHNRLLRGFL